MVKVQMGASLSALVELPMLQSHDGGQPRASLSPVIAESIVLFFANTGRIHVVQTPVVLFHHFFGGLLAARRPYAELPWQVATCPRAPRTAHVSDGSNSI